jgi:hypothetical protein
MLKKLTFTLTILASLFALSLVYTGCGDDDGTSENPNEKFFGTYEGAFSCGSPFDLINDDMVQFEITAPANPSNTSKVTVSANITLPLSLEGDVDGNNIVFKNKVLNNIDIQGITTDITFSGTGTLNGKNFTAALMLTANLPVIGPVTSNCNYSGVKL